MKFIYDLNKTQQRMEEEALSIKRIKYIRQLSRTFYSFTFSFAVFGTLTLLTTPSSGQNNTFKVIGTILFYLASAFWFQLSEKKDSDNGVLTPDMLYDRSLNANAIFSVNYKDTGENCVAVFVLTDRDLEVTLSCKREMKCIHSPDISEETIDLEENIIYLPCSSNDETDK